MIWKKQLWKRLHFICILLKLALFHCCNQGCLNFLFAAPILPCCHISEGRLWRNETKEKHHVSPKGWRCSCRADQQHRFVCLFVFAKIYPAWCPRQKQEKPLPTGSQTTRENCWVSTYLEGSGSLLLKKSEGVGGILRSCVVVCWSHWSNMCPTLANNTKNWWCYCCFCYYFFIIFAAASSVFSCLHFQPFFRFVLCGEEDGGSKVEP